MKNELGSAMVEIALTIAAISIIALVSVRSSGEHSAEAFCSAYASFSATAGSDSAVICPTSGAKPPSGHGD